jgi:excisionase family DNA binding protein
MDTDLSLTEAAIALNVQADTVRRWDTQGKITTIRDVRNRRRVPVSEVHRIAESRSTPLMSGASSGRDARCENLFPGVVESVEMGGVMALVEIEAGPFRLTAAVTCDDVEGLRLNAGIPVTAIVSPTSILISRD